MAAVGKVLIVGGGVAGLALAICLRRRGIACEIAEQKRDWSVLGVGFSLTGPMLRALAAVGVRDRCIAVACPYNEIVINDRLGKRLAVLPMQRLNGPDLPANVGIMRPLLHSILAAEAQAAGAGIRLGLSVSAIDQSDAAVTVRFTDGSVGSYDLVVGADGFRSRVRALAFPDAPRPFYTGQMVWRFMLKRPPELDTMHLFYGSNGKPGFVPLPDGEALLFFTQNAAERVRLDEKRLWDILRASLADYGGFMAMARDQLDPASKVSYRYMDALMMPAPWYRGRVILIGDAAHITSPHVASGAAIATEDAVLLAELLSGENVLVRALEGFMARRFARCKLVVENSLQLGEWEKDPATPAAQVSTLMRQTWATLAEPI